MSTPKPSIVRPAKLSDAEAIRTIYNYYVEKTIVTFETELVTTEQMRDRIREVTSYSHWFVAESANGINGYAYACQWKSRCGFRFTLESTIYVSPHAVGIGIGRTLYAKLISTLRDTKFHAIVAGIALPNPASIALHEKMGFEKVAHFPQVGWKFDKWIDVGYWQLILDKM